MLDGTNVLIALLLCSSVAVPASNLAIEYIETAPSFEPITMAGRVRDGGIERALRDLARAIDAGPRPDQRATGSESDEPTVTVNQQPRRQQTRRSLDPVSVPTSPEPVDTTADPSNEPNNDDNGNSIPSRPSQPVPPPTPTPTPTPSAMSTEDCPEERTIITLDADVDGIGLCVRIGAG